MSIHEEREQVRQAVVGFFRYYAHVPSMALIREMEERTRLNRFLIVEEIEAMIGEGMLEMHRYKERKVLDWVEPKRRKRA